MVQLEASKSIIKDLLKDLLDEIKGFKYQVTVKVLLSKHKENGAMEFAPVYFNSTTKAVINSKYTLINLFKKCRMGSIIRLIKDLIESVYIEYVNISIFSLCLFFNLSGSTYIELPGRLRNSMKGLININKNDNKCFLWCNIKHLNPLKTHPEK